MSYASLLDETVTIYNPDAQSDDFDNAHGDFDAGTPTPARVQRLDAGMDVSEDIINRDTRITQFLVFLPGGTDVSALSEIDRGAVRLRIVGEPAHVHGRSGEHHVELYAQEVAG